MPEKTKKRRQRPGTGKGPGQRIKQTVRRHRYVLAAFLLPVLVTTLAFAVTGIYPFGENQITVIDMYHQYVPFLSELQYKLQHGGSLFYSWHGAGGFNFWNLLAYYGASPLNLLLFFFPAGLIVEGVTFLLLIKQGLAGCFMYLFLTYQYGGEARVWLRSEKAGAWSRVAFGSLYALCAYMCGYFWCIMWLDVVALLPLIMLGLSKLIEEKKGVLYAVSLGLACFCNYYIAMMMCIFIVLYYLMLWFKKPRQGGSRAFVTTTCRVAVYSLIGAALASPMLVPTYISMKNTYYTPASLPEEWSFYSPALEVVNQLLPLSHLSYREGLPNLCCGLLVCMMLVCFFVSRTIPQREKVVHGMLLAVLFFSLNVNTLNFLWHGCHFPNELPFRWSFAVSFLLVSMACQALTRLPQIRQKTLWAIFAGGLGYYMLAAKVLEGSPALDDADAFFYIGVVLLAIYTAILMSYRKGWLTAHSISLLLVLVVGAELLCTVTMSFDKVGNVERAPYLENSKEIAELTDQTKDDFARTELYRWSLMNTPALYHYRGMSQFSSSLNANATELMEKIGLEGEPGKNRYNYVFSDPVTNAILNMKYIIATDETVEDEYFRQIGESGEATMYENQYPLSIGYMLPESIRTWDLISTNPFDVLNDYIRAATSNSIQRLFLELEDPETEGFAATVSTEADGLLSGASEEGEAGSIDMVYTARETATHYVYIEAEQAASIDVVYEDGSVLSLREDCGAVVNIGSIEKGEEFTIEINYETDGGGSIRAHVCTMNQAGWEKAYGLMSRNMMEVTSFGDRYLEGKINASEAGIFTTSVLNEEGWSMEIDGQDQEITELVGGDFIAAALEAGEHTVRLSFRPPGLIPGCVLLVLGVLALIILEGGRIQLPTRRGTKAAAPSAAPEPDQL